MKKLLLLLLLPLTGYSTSYYVTPNGVDYGPGDRTTPWGTIAYAVGYNTPARDGDTIYVQAGIYAKPVSVIYNRNGRQRLTARKDGIPSGIILLISAKC